MSKFVLVMFVLFEAAFVISFITSMFLAGATTGAQASHYDNIAAGFAAATFFGAIANAIIITMVEV